MTGYANSADGFWRAAILPGRTPRAFRQDRPGRLVIEETRLIEALRSSDRRDRRLGVHPASMLISGGKTKTRAADECLVQTMPSPLGPPSGCRPRTRRRATPAETGPRLDEPEYRHHVTRHSPEAG